MKSNMVYQIVELDEHDGIDTILATYMVEESAQAGVDLINKLSYHAEVELREQEVTKEVVE